MPTDGDTTPQAGDPGNTPTQTPAPETPVNWEAKFYGLKGNVDKLKAERDEYKHQFEELTGTHTQIITEHVELNKSKQTLEQQLTSITSERDTYKSAAEKLQHENEVLLLVSTEFKGLAEDFAAGRLRTDGLTGDALKDYLKGWHDRLQGVQQNAHQDALKGAAPPIPTPQPDQKLTLPQWDALLKQVQREKGIGSPEYQSTFAQYLEAAKKGFK